MSGKKEGEELARQFCANFAGTEPGIVRLYEEVFKEREDKESPEDLEIDYMNQKRSIKLELSAEEKLLYTYSQGVTREVLESISKKFLEQVETVPPASCDLEDMPSLERK